MANANRGLGKGLGALLGDAALRTDTSDNLYLPISQIEPYANQPRRHFDEEALQDLADSIREHGIIQPLTVRRLSSGYYQIIAGERRWRAARIAGLAEVPAIVIEADDRKMTELSLIENLQREDLDPIEEAEGYKTLMDNYHLTQEEAAERVGKSRSAVANSLRLLGLCPEVRQMLQNGDLSGGHARALLPLKADLQLDAANLIVKQGLSVRQTEALAKRLANPKEERKPTNDELIAESYGRLAAQELSDKIGRTCRIVSGKKNGRIELAYYGIDDLNDLLSARRHQTQKERRRITMSDLIHEGPKDPNKPPVPGEEKPTTERERMKKVYTYVAILFTVAFLLILWTFFMNQRSINEIKDGNTALQSTLQQNDSLEAHIAELEEQLANSEEDKKALDETVGLQSNQLRALDWLLEIENAYNTGDLDAAKDNIRSFEETGTVEFLPKEPLRTGITGDDAPSPAARYQSIVDKLFPDGVK